ncbi:flagellar hook protein FlgE [Campylobacter hyointestinalis]|uniref:Flagellar hook protein FlgE n=1 Tax=Campylobacter hyointestinalis subsp. lawsonii TaxID=91353 RepID=A0AAV6EIX4_CAMHY|nr:flagellar hook protein FlgE [Campylobacter hyointestinalis]KAB0613749.1 flagellar hook protein FlgE [Campylobacter hyointestinalis subsp. lawsonii]QKF70290.1 flagellar hook protein, epsilonproteobacterial variant [Campylobacter hyointestinalis subsp. lawsonii]RAZ29225.1 flagellar hook protein FlgE [Campylobacter hyointestinalis subsp. lawsonii]
MMRSLWAGVTGLQAHQIAMDVEGNNIANVNTVGFKYSRVSFADLVSQTDKVATAPQGELGGKNPMQIGLGTQINAVTKIFKQGSIQTTDKNTDVAIQGDGFFIVSPDGGNTKYFTRNGDFSFDSLGNFVDKNGYIAQGWLRDEDTGIIDPTSPVKNIQIEPGLGMPANPTSEIKLKGNLNSGDNIGTQKSPIYSLDSKNGWLDLNGNDIMNDGEIHVENDTNDDRFYVDKNKQMKLQERGVDLGVLFNDAGEGFNLREGQGMWVSYADAKYTFKPNIQNNNAQFGITLNGIPIPTTTVTKADEIVAKINEYTPKTGVNASLNGGDITLINKNSEGTTDSMKNIKIAINGQNGAGMQNTNVITAYKYTYSAAQSTAQHGYDDKIARVVHTTEDLRRAMQTDARLHVKYTGKTQNGQGQDAITENDRNDGVEITINEKGQFVIKNPAGDAFNDEDKRPNGNQLPQVIEDTIDATGGKNATNAETNVNDKNMYLTITGYSDAANNINENTKLADAFKALSGGLSSGTGNKTSNAVYMSTHSSTIEIFDSLGSKHEIKVDFAKTGYSAENGTEWSMVIQVPEPAKLRDDAPTNVITGTIKFKPDGSLLGFNPTALTFTANNGSEPGQNIELNFGKSGDFNGMTSNNRKSSTDNIAQDGYAAGTLSGTRIDESGTIIGSFTNGRSFGLAQLSLASFTNNEGLESMGGNVFIQTANSGDPVIGSAQTAGRGKVNASSLEMSNVDLSRSLTQLIIVQRGYQANSKTITTSDQMLNTLLQLKQ